MIDDAEGKDPIKQEQAISEKGESTDQTAQKAYDRAHKLRQQVDFFLPSPQASEDPEAEKNFVTDPDLVPRTDQKAQEMADNHPHTLHTKLEETPETPTGQHQPDKVQSD